MTRKPLKVPPRKKVPIVRKGDEREKLERIAKRVGFELIDIDETGSCLIQGPKGRFRFEAWINTSSLHAEVTLESYKAPELEKLVTDAMRAPPNPYRLGAACRALRDHPTAKWIETLQCQEQAKIDSARKQMERHRRKLKEIERKFGLDGSSRRPEVQKRQTVRRRRRARKRIPAGSSPRSK